MRLIRVALLFALLACPLVVASSAGALDLCEQECQPPEGEQNTPYEWAFEGEEGCVPYRYTYLNGTVPPGLKVTANGLLTGTPTDAGTFDFWVGLDDNSGPQNPACPEASMQSQAHFFVTILRDLAVTTTSLPLATPGSPYSTQLQFSNPEAGWPVIWDIVQGSLPLGLSLSEKGVISGTPTGPDVKQFVVRAREPFRRFGERQLTLTVATALQASSVVGPGEVGLRYRGAIRATGGLQPLTWSLASGSLPRGLSLNTATGAISGKPQAAGSSALTFAVTDAGGQRVTVPATLRIAARLAITTARLPQATAGDAYRAQLSSGGGLAPKQWRIAQGSLPRGITLDRRTGVLSGVPRATGTFRVTVQVTDRLGGKSSKRLSLSIAG